MIRIFQPSLGQDELDAVAAVFTDQWPGAGRRVKAFEEEFAKYIGTGPEQMISITSCTEGLFQAVDALQLRPSDEVILPTISFIGAAHAVLASGCRLRLVDVDPQALNPRPQHIEEAINCRTRAILLLHYGGRLTWINDIVELARRNNIVLIEDSACALGGRSGGSSYGTLGDIGIWSFDAMKLLVTGDGGMLRVTNESLRQRIYDRIHLGGVMPGLENARTNRTSWWEVNPNSWGRMSFMNDLAAAIGLAQLRRIETFIERRKNIARAYDSLLGRIPWVHLPASLNEEAVPYFYWIQVPPGARDRLANFLREHGVYTTFRYWPLHRTVLYGDAGSYPGADIAADTTLLLPVHQNLSDSEVNWIVESIGKFKF